jgi:DNA-binding XRE family transcriptional regulator
MLIGRRSGNGKIQIIYDEKGPAFVVLPVSEYLARFPDASLSDEELFDLAKGKSGEERTPHEIVKRLVEGENPVKVFREWRGLTQEELASGVGVSTGYVSQVERGARRLSRKTQTIIAEALGVEAEELDAG